MNIIEMLFATDDRPNDQGCGGCLLFLVIIGLCVGCICTGILADPNGAFHTP